MRVSTVLRHHIYRLCILLVYYQRLVLSHAKDSTEGKHHLTIQYSTHFVHNGAIQQSCRWFTCMCQTSSLRRPRKILKILQIMLSIPEIRNYPTGTIHLFLFTEWLQNGLNNILEACVRQENIVYEMSHMQINITWKKTNPALIAEDCRVSFDGLDNPHAKQQQTVFWGQCDSG